MNKTLKTLIITALVLAMIPLAITYNKFASANRNLVPKNTKPAKVVYPEVGVWSVEADNYQASVTGFGEAQSKFQLTLVAEVSGKIIQLSDQFASGFSVENQALLAKVDATNYQQALATAKVNLAEAKLVLLEEENQVAQAKLEWGQSGFEGTPDSALVLREPYLIAAQTKVEQAISQVQVAQQDLEKTQVRAPFDAIIVNRNVQLGSYVQQGAEIATLYSKDKLEIAIPLSANEWRLLPNLESLNTKPWLVTLSSQENNQQWQARVERTTSHIDTSSRQRSIIVVVDNPLNQPQPLYPGTFVKAKIEGKTLTGLWKVPASAISQNNTLWLVDNKQVLKEVPAKVLFSANQFSYVQPPEGETSADVVIRPLNTYLVGMRVTAIKEGAIKDDASAETAL
ncbi:MAG TPA: efflux RND transporter periplasmic adaptor subunit [Marinospirillum sp.]|uniref:efflux RND transporter periplasmic adaptor subunit n=1 Tax=Marinospirillum sp. TaxID=2183934 RepID=UPI002B484B59|nr:efflux RND transporter periplasmic adaptor subunit [Marinospirillum sp.]HKM16076.1 efflux RND transporter periplasmic adaptor subunit [Marinospirillum sp.]